MSYVELYKKYRPKNWNEVVGQDNVIKSLKEAILEDSIPTGYIFSGKAGTGKTTMARILAKAVNCLNLKDGEPCNECEHCVKIEEGTQVGVSYIAMANNGGVNEVREIMEESLLAKPVKKKVFILDEIQNCSKSAFDAMLIGLESKNQKSLFICCTTEPHKIPDSFKSRLQVRTLNSVSSADLLKLIVKIAKEENLKGKLTKEKVTEIIAMSDGSARTAISNLETVIMNGELQISYANKILKTFLDGNLTEMILLTDEITKKNQDPVKLLEQFYKSLMDIFKIKANIAVENKDKYATMNLNVNSGFLMNRLDDLVDVFGNMSNKIIDPNIILGNFLIHITNKRRKEIAEIAKRKQAQ